MGAFILACGLAILQSSAAFATSPQKVSYQAPRCVSLDHVQDIWRTVLTLRFGGETVLLHDVSAAISQIVASRREAYEAERAWELCVDVTEDQPLTEARIADHSTHQPLVRSAFSTDVATVNAAVGFAASASSPQILSVLVDNLEDSDASPSACGTSSGHCNFRSAVAYCAAAVSAAPATCSIDFPALQLVVMDPTHGSIEIFGGNGSIIINGNGCIISKLSGVIATSALLRMGAALMDELSFTLKNLTITSFNSAEEFGGALYFSHLASALIEDVIFLNNTGADGGGVYAHSSDHVQLLRCTFQYDSADMSSNGGGIFFSDCTRLIIMDSLFISNSAAKSGGAIYLDSFNVGLQVHRELRCCQRR